MSWSDPEGQSGRAMATWSLLTASPITMTVVSPEDTRRTCARACAPRRHGRDAGGDLGPILEGFQHSVDGLDPPAGARGETRARLADGVDRVGVHPVVPLGPAHLVGGIEEQRLVEIVQNAPEVIGMPMGEDHVRDVVGRQPLGIERVQKATRRWPGRHGPRRSRTGSCGPPGAGSVTLQGGVSGAVRSMPRSRASSPARPAGRGRR
jgi:hypothetical protein